MIPALGIDFGRRKSPYAGKWVLLLLLAAGACLAAWLDYRGAGRESRELARQGREASLELERLRHRAANPEGAALPAEAVGRINRAITQLNLPWRELFGIFEQNAAPGVALLALEPDSRKGLLRVAAEARGPDEMADFLQSLLAEPRFAEVILVRHEINEEDRNRPVRFVLEARWRMER